MMTGYEIIKRNIEFGGPERIGLRCSEYGVDDTAGMTVLLAAGWKPRIVDDGVRYEDEWGTIWHRTEVENCGRIEALPIKDVKEVYAYKIPDADDASRYVKVNENLENAKDKYVLTGVGSLFQNMTFRIGFEETLVGLCDHRKEMEYLADGIVTYMQKTMRNIRKYYHGQIHGCKLCDDWGTQNGPIIDPVLWDDFFAPRYKVLWDEMHGYGWHTWMHCCGKVAGLLDRFIECGLDCIEIGQPRALGIKEVGARFRGRLCFETCVDYQTTLVTGSDEEVEQEAVQLITRWGNGRGGVIVAPYSPLNAIGVSRERMELMVRLFEKHGVMIQGGLA